MQSVQYVSTPYLPQHPEQDVVYLKPVSHLTEIPQRLQALSRLQKWGYALLSVALVFIGFQALRCGMVSALKVKGLLVQQAAVARYHQEALAKQAQLEDNIALYQSPTGIEEIARDRLGLVGPNEILVRVYPASVAQR